MLHPFDTILPANSLPWLDELDTVAKRIAELESIIAGNGNAVQNFDAPRREAPPPGGQIAHLISQVRLGHGPVHTRLRSDMDLPVTRLKPEPAAPTQRLG